MLQCYTRIAIKFIWKIQKNQEILLYSLNRNPVYTYLLVFVLNFRKDVSIEFGNSAKRVNFEEDVSREKCLNTISSLFDLNIEASGF